MSDDTQYAVYLHPGALEALGEAIKPYLTNGANGAHIVCHDLDTGGALCEMCVAVKNAEGKTTTTEVMVPIAMIRLVLSIGGVEDRFGFHGAD
jgi:hypothetical protein